jgi:TRAP-type C4-dicarboxylate transport system permease small subunit
VLDKFERFNRRLSGWCEWLGLAGMLLMMAITCIDVVGAKVFGWRLLGAIDIVMLSQIVAIAFAVSMSLILGRHIQVEFFFQTAATACPSSNQQLCSSSWIRTLQCDYLATLCAWLFLSNLRRV